MVRYIYNAWGNHTVSGNSTIGNLNPFRYRGYYYDTKTGLKGCLLKKVILFMDVKKAPIIIAIICFLLACVSLFIIFFVPSVIKTYYDETNTVEHSAIIVNVETNNEECEIFVEEFSCSLKIKTAEIINESYLLELDSGTEIIFRIPENFEQFLYDSDVNSLRIVAVKTNNANIVTLESHNALEQKSNNIIRITGIIFATIFLVITLISLKSVFKRR